VELSVRSIGLNTLFDSKQLQERLN